MAYALAILSKSDYKDHGGDMLNITLLFSLATIWGIGAIIIPILKRANVLPPKQEESATPIMQH